MQRFEFEVNVDHKFEARIRRRGNVSIATFDTNDVQSCSAADIGAYGLVDCDLRFVICVWRGGRGVSFRILPPNIPLRLQYQDPLQLDRHQQRSHHNLPNVQHSA